MKIKGIDIRVTRKSPGSVGADIVVTSLMQKEEGRIRAYYHSALAKAAKKKQASIAFVVEDLEQGRETLYATAKILAQEIFRLLHEDKHSLRRIVVCAKSAKAYEACKKNTLGYMDYIEYRLKSPFLTVDAIIEYKGGVVLIKRSNPPFGWAIPGGFVDYGESLEEAVIREAKEETNLDISGLRQMHTYSDPDRDPRFHTVCTVFIAKGKGIPCAGDDAAGIRIVYPQELKTLDLAFNHGDVLKDYLKLKAGKNPY
jgi:8-oxo-dGTP diphosphatase